MPLLRVYIYIVGDYVDTFYKYDFCPRIFDQVFKGKAFRPILLKERTIISTYPATEVGRSDVS